MRNSSIKGEKINPQSKKTETVNKSAPPPTTQNLPQTDERMIPHAADAVTLAEHLYRYRFATNYTAACDVLDVACGEGYGASGIKLRNAKSVIGIDVDKTACDYVSNRYKIKTHCASAEALPLPSNSIDTIVSFETIEHLTRPKTFLDECERILRPQGTLVLSTPNKNVYRQGGAPNPFHVNELGLDELLPMVTRDYALVNVWWQSATFASSKITNIPYLIHKIRRYLFLRFGKYWINKMRRDAAMLIAAESEPLPKILNTFRVYDYNKRLRITPGYWILVCTKKK